MIVTKLKGGLGNQLFQYAIGRCLAHKHKTTLKFDIGFYDDKKDSHHNHYKLSAFNIKESFATPKEFERLKVIKEPIVNNVSLNFQPKILESPDNIFLYGYWHSESYFEEISDIIKCEFKLKKTLEKTSSEWEKKILATDCAVSVHVRHGDYLNYASRNNRGLLSAGYYLECINLLRKDYPNITVFVFSDDMQWCKENFKFGVPTEFVEGCEHDYEELYLMSCCKHNVISNSTFSWWGAWLNQNPDKKIFTPNPWHNNGWGGNTIVPESWIKVPVNYFLEIAPEMSLIVYFENNMRNIKSSLQSIVGQMHFYYAIEDTERENPPRMFTFKFRDYEIILVDASTAETGKICRQLSQNENVTLLKVNPMTNKFAAWNKGLNVARGDYVMFLTGNDFIMPSTIQIFAVICEQLLKIRGNSSQNYVTYSTFGNYIPNIISSVQRLEEDINGAIKLDGIPDKKFTLKPDSAFDKLKKITEISWSSQRKLMALGLNGINGLVGTKFFKRKFLEENHIRFNEGEGVDAELAFVVNAFMATEKITFVPQLFYGRLK